MRAFRTFAGVAVLAIVAAVSIPGAASAAVAEAPAAHGSVAALTGAGLPMGVDDFTFDSFDGVYQLSQDSSKRSMLHTTETLVAEFPSYDQNRGIIRSIPTDYDGHSTHITVKSVTDGNGQARSFSMGTNGDFTTITIAVPEGSYVHGKQSYLIDYTQTDVTKFFADSNDDEFYWDVNGTGWEQEFGEVSASVTVAGALAPKLNGKTACYQGPEGSTESCEVTGDDGTFTAQAKNLGPEEGMTLAIGFTAKTFASAPFNLFDIIGGFLSQIPITFQLGFLAELLAVVGAAVLHFQFWRRRTGQPIIAQYEPPTGVSAMLAANIVGKPKKGMAASIVDLAVRGKLRIIEKPKQGYEASQFGVQKVSDDGLLPDEQSVMNALFEFTGFGDIGAMIASLGVKLPPGLKVIGGEPAAAGSTTADAESDAGVKWLKKDDTLLGDSVRTLTKSVEANAESVGLRKPRHPAIVTVIGILAIVGAVLLFLTAFASDSGLGIALGVIGANAGAWIVIGIFASISGIRPLTLDGSKLYDQLMGLKLYISLAEADRLKMLQSISGADKISTSDGNQIIKIYERLLPYAVLFGLEQQWSAELATYYGTTSPDWYSGNMAGFSAGAFAGSIASFSTFAALTTSSSSSGGGGFSSSGGSGGGGSSGGGGGGGGGGGI
ncbi:MAG TPA: DUF2207 domain-containing protein [Pseudolysinimonas sp.]|jgi:uncharacterized membrane protein YgcG